MSQEARQALVDSPNTIFQRDSQRADLLDENKTSTYLIEMLTYLCITKDWPLEFTALVSDHHDDSELSSPPDYVGTHFRGWAWDGWVLNSTTAGDYTDAQALRFQLFLKDLRSAPSHLQTGLAGSAWTPLNREAAGPTAFHDDGGDHIHVGAQP